MRILVTYASRHGATEGIAQRIGERLAGQGFEVEVKPVGEAGDVPGYYDAFVIGSAVYMSHWLKEITQWVRRHSNILLGRPVWLFSSGPLGTDAVDAEGKDVCSSAEPKEFAEFKSSIRPRQMRVFFGAYDPEAKPVGLAEKLMSVMPAAREALPAGDFRDWAEIDGWAATIGTELSRPSDQVA
jgi:menaquinone-dependent protoporphyrinogen oxidase